MLFVYLLQSGIGSTFAYLEFHDVDMGCCLYNQVYATFGKVLFHFDIIAHQRKDDKGNILILLLKEIVALFLWNLGVRNLCNE